MRSGEVVTALSNVFDGMVPVLTHTHTADYSAISMLAMDLSSLA